ncbi:hypothetical protein Tco_0459968 [Tanacetum coccineum]
MVAWVWVAVTGIGVVGKCWLEAWAWACGSGVWAGEGERVVVVVGPLVALVLYSICLGGGEVHGVFSMLWNGIVRLCKQKSRMKVGRFKARTHGVEPGNVVKGTVTSVPISLLLGGFGTRERNWCHVAKKGVEASLGQIRLHGACTNSQSEQCQKHRRKAKQTVKGSLSSMPRSRTQSKQSKGQSGGWLLSDRVEIAGTITTEQKPTGLASYWGCRNLVGHSARIEVVGPAEIVGLTETDGPARDVGPAEKDREWRSGGLGVLAHKGL